MTPTSILQEYHHALEMLRAAREPQLEALRETTVAALGVIDKATAHEARRARGATRALRAVLGQDARFLLDDAGYQAFRGSLRTRETAWTSAATGGLAALRRPDLRVAFDAYRRTVEQEYNDEEYFLVRQVTIRVTVGTAQREVSVWLARRFVADPHFVRLAPSLDRLPYELDDLVAQGLNTTSVTEHAIAPRATDHTLVDELRNEVGALLLFSIPLLRPTSRTARLPWP